MTDFADKGNGYELSKECRWLLDTKKEKEAIPLLKSL